MLFHSSSYTSVSYLLSEVSISLPNTKFSVSLSKKEEMVTQKYLNKQGPFSVPSAGLHLHNDKRTDETSGRNAND